MLSDLLLGVKPLPYHIRYNVTRDRERPVDEPKGVERFKKAVPENVDINSEKTEEIASRWSKWLNDEWYGNGGR